MLADGYSKDHEEDCHHQPPIILCIVIIIVVVDPKSPMASAISVAFEVVLVTSHDGYLTLILSFEENSGFMQQRTPPMSQIDTQSWSEKRGIQNYITVPKVRY